MVDGWRANTPSTCLTLFCFVLFWVLILGEELFFDYRHEHTGLTPQWLQKDGQTDQQSSSSSKKS